MKLKSRFCSISVPNGEPLVLFDYVPKVDPPVFNSLYDYLSFDLKGYKREFDGEAEFDDYGNLLTDIDEFASDSQDLFDDIDNGVDSVVDSFSSWRAEGTSLASERPNEELSEQASETTNEEVSEPSI